MGVQSRPRIKPNTHRTKMTYTSYNYLNRYPFALQDKYNPVDVMTDTLRRSCRARSEMDDMLMSSLEIQRDRYYREFLSPQPKVGAGYYYPKHEVSEAGSPHISYLARPYLNYRVPSKYGHSKYCTVRKL